MGLVGHGGSVLIKSYGRLFFHYDVDEATQGWRLVFRRHDDVEPVPSGYGRRFATHERTLEHGTVLFIMEVTDDVCFLRACGRSWRLEDPGVQLRFEHRSCVTSRLSILRDGSEEARFTYRHIGRSLGAAFNPTYLDEDWFEDHMLVEAAYRSDPSRFLPGLDPS